MAQTFTTPDLRTDAIDADLWPMVADNHQRQRGWYPTVPVGAHQLRPGGHSPGGRMHLERNDGRGHRRRIGGPIGVVQGDDLLAKILTFTEHRRDRIHRRPRPAGQRQKQTVCIQSDRDGTHLDDGLAMPTLVKGPESGKEQRLLTRKGDQARQHVTAAFQIRNGKITQQMGLVGPTG